ncbi:MAG: acylphosphatase [Rhodospirillales bacterium]
MTLEAMPQYDDSFVREADQGGRRWTLTGRVQGVGFRWFVWRVARRLDLDGTVRNLPGGEVEVVARGEPDRLARLEASLRQGPPGARVDGVVSGSAPAPVAGSGFAITS